MIKKFEKELSWNMKYIMEDPEYRRLIEYNRDSLRQALSIRRQAIELIVQFDNVVKEKINQLDLGDFCACKLVSPAEPDLLIYITRAGDQLSMEVFPNTDSLPPGGVFLKEENLDNDMTFFKRNDN